jgi:hypothetical protein
VIPVLLAGLLAAQLFILWRIHPDELAYFNAFAGPDPGALLADSDLDWGQDLNRLEDLVHQFDIHDLNIAYFGTARLCDPPMTRLSWLPPGQRRSGWIAISENYLRGAWIGSRRDVCDVAAGWILPPPGDDYSWLMKLHTPVAFAGKSIRLYYVATGQ